MMPRTARFATNPGQRPSYRDSVRCARQGRHRIYDYAGVKARQESSIPDEAKLLQRAVLYQRSGRLAEAAEICSEILRSKARHFEAQHLLGVLRHQQGRSAEAIDLLSAVVKTRPDPMVLSNFGAVLQDLGRHAEALGVYDQALALDPERAEVHNNRASALIELRRFEEAVAACNRAAAMRPTYAEALFNRGIALHELGRHEEALASFDRTLILVPSLAQAHQRRGAVLMAIKRYTAALEAFDRAIAARPDHVEALYNRGLALDALKRPDEALAAFDRVLAMDPTHVQALNNRGVVLDETKRHAEAVASYGRAISLKADYFEALTNRATALVEIERYDEAMADYAAALAMTPNDVESRWNRSLLLLRRGDFLSGWKEYEWRRRQSWWLARDFSGPEWDGRNVSGQKLLFYAEQGLGDTIQFARFAGVVARAGATVTLEVQPELERLVSSLEGVSVIAKGGVLPEYDAHLPLMSLPHILGVTTESLPACVPYLNAEPARIAFWVQTLPRDGFKVGIVWQGNPKAPGDRGRSIPLAAFGPLAKIPGVRLISLQKNEGTEQLRELPATMSIETLGPGFDSDGNAFLDSGAVIMNLDLVVTSDTAMAHLAGALGRPTFLALKRVADWRFMIKGESPWYPTMRLFRQNVDGDWKSVFDEIKSALCEIMEK